MIVLTILLLFGGSQIPRLARSIGRARKEFESGLKEGESDPPKSDPPKSDPPKSDPEKSES